MIPVCDVNGSGIRWTQWLTRTDTIRMLCVLFTLLACFTETTSAIRKRKLPVGGSAKFYCDSNKVPTPAGQKVKSVEVLKDTNVIMKVDKATLFKSGPATRYYFNASGFQAKDVVDFNVTTFIPYALVEDSGRFTCRITYTNNKNTILDGLQTTVTGKNPKPPKPPEPEYSGSQDPWEHENISVIWYLFVILAIVLVSLTIAVVIALMALPEELLQKYFGGVVGKKPRGTMSGEGEDPSLAGSDAVDDTKGGLVVVMDDSNLVKT